MVQIMLCLLFVQLYSVKSWLKTHSKGLINIGISKINHSVLWLNWRKKSTFDDPTLLCINHVTWCFILWTLDSKRAWHSYLKHLITRCILNMFYCGQFDSNHQPLKVESFDNKWSSGWRAVQLQTVELKYSTGNQD